MSKTGTFPDLDASDTAVLTSVGEPAADFPESPALHIHAFGAPTVVVRGATLAFTRRKSVALLVFLAITRHAHTRDALATLLWSGLGQERALANLRKALNELRERVGDAVHITRQTVVLTPAYPVTLDVAVFEDAVDRGIAMQSRPALTAAIAHYHDEFLASFYLTEAEDFDTWVLLYREHLRNRLIEALQTLAALHAAAGEDRAAIAATTRLIALDPWREEAYRQLMVLLARTGERSGAIAQYEACRRVLADELGVEPMAETTALYRQLLAAPADPDLHQLGVPLGADPPASREARMLPDAAWDISLWEEVRGGALGSGLVAETKLLLARLRVLGPSELRMLATNLGIIADALDEVVER
jgi:DNA-binding SARP family transcriptional activator